MGFFIVRRGGGKIGFRLEPGKPGSTSFVDRSEVKKRSKKPFITAETVGFYFPLMVKAKPKVWKVPSLRCEKGKYSFFDYIFYLNDFTKRYNLMVVLLRITRPNS
jgi:hypothetical protein